TQGLYQLVHLARADAEDVGLLDDSHQRFLGAAPWLQQAREIASLPQFGNAEVDGAHPRLPSTLTVAVAMRHTLRRPLVTVRTALAAPLALHQQLREPLQRVAKKVGAGSPLVKQLLKCHSKVSGHGWVPPLRCNGPTRMEPNRGHSCQKESHGLEFTPLSGTLTNLYSGLGKPVEFIAELAAPILLGLLHGSLFTLMGIGLTMTFSVTRMINFAHAELVTLGAYATVVTVNMYGWGIGPAIAAAMVLSLVVAVVIDEAIYKPLTSKRAPDLYVMVASIGVSMVLRHLIYIFADLNGLLNVKARVLLQPVMFIGYGTVTNVHTYAVPGALLIAAGLHVFLTR